MTDGVYRVHGRSHSYFTRKMTGYMTYKGIPFLRRRTTNSQDLLDSGWPGGIPIVKTPDGQFMWDTTAMILHLEGRFGERSVLPDDPTMRFLCFLLEDYSDEWLFRPAVAARWFYEENAIGGGWDLARESTFFLPMTCDEARAQTEARISSSCTLFGASRENVQAWVDEVLLPWQRAMERRLADQPYMLGARPSLADIALFGGNIAHFISDPVCRRWTESTGRRVIEHTHRLLEPEDQIFGGWLAPDDLPGSFIGLLEELGRFYLPWVSEAVVAGSARLEFANGQSIDIAATDFLREARSIMLARYVEFRNPTLDAILERAGLLTYFADHIGEAGTIPDYSDPPQPALSRSFPPSNEAAPRRQ